MTDNIFTELHLLLMEEVDGSAADRFLCHVSRSLGDLEELSLKYHPMEMLQWMIRYWINQLSLYMQPCDIHELYSLMEAVNTESFLKAFKLTALPILNDQPNLPDLSMVLHPIIQYQITEGRMSHG